MKLPEEIGKYKIVRKLGDGGMGSVDLAIEKHAGTELAIKVLYSEYAKDKEFITRFRLEVKSLIRLSHANIVHILEFGREREILFFVMEYLSEGNLYQKLQQSAPFAEDYALKIAYQIGKALQHAHRRHILHRDIKPENILLGKNGVAKLTDWGIAKELDSEMRLTQSGVVYGTPYYMSPEQVKGDRATSQSDIYALGATLYHMLAGVPPFQGKTEAEIMDKQLWANVVSIRKYNPNISPATDKLVMKMMHKSLKKRFRSARAMTFAIRTILRSKNRHRNDENWWENFCGWWEMHKMRVIVIALFLTAMILGFIIGKSG